MVKLYSLQNTLQFRELMNVLEQEHIPCYSKESGSGEYLKIAYGFSFYGTDLYIDDENQKQAKSLLNDLRQQWDLEEMQTGWVEDDEKKMQDKIGIPWYKNRVIVARIILMFFLCGVILSGISILF
ncbi:MAG: DUF2007 domain-containing protein [Lachnospiraceae bacterium]|nr:DUF2007 domain-containing protein [Lachnospiraceae bacterium]